MTEHRRRLDHGPQEALLGVGRAAEAWGAEWQPDAEGGLLALPVVAGLRRGVVQGRLTAEPHGSGTELTLQVERDEYRVHLASVMVLLLAAAGGLMVMLWPVVGVEALPLAAVGAVLALCGWFLVVSRLTNHGVEDFLEMAEELIDESDGEPTLDERPDSR